MHMPQTGHLAIGVMTVNIRPQDITEALCPPRAGHPINHYCELKPFTYMLIRRPMAECLDTEKMSDHPTANDPMTLITK